MNIRLVAGIAVLVAAAGAGWIARGVISDRDLAQLHTKHSTELTRIAQERDAQARNALQAQQDAQAAVAEIDRTHYEAMKHAQDEIDGLRAAVRAGERRLSIRATCPAGANVPGAAAGAGVDPASGRADIDPGAAERIVSLTDRGDQAIRQLTACQAILRTLRRD